MSPQTAEPAGTQAAPPPEQEPPRRSLVQRLRRRPMLILILVLVLALIAIGGFFAWSYYSVRESTDDAQIDGHVNPVSAKVGGTVMKVTVDDNQYVTAGTLLVQIDPKDYEVALQHARANLDSAEAAAKAAATRVPLTSTTSTSQVETARAALEQTEAAAVSAAREVEAVRARLASAQAQARQAEANYKKAAQDLERMKALIAKDEISRQQYDAAVAAADAARGQRDAAQAAIREAERTVESAEARHTQSQGSIARARAELAGTATAPQQVTISRADAEAAAARVEQARAALKQAQLNLEYASLLAPVSGIVAKKSVEVGQVIQPGQPLMAVVPLEDIWVIANFKETQLRYMKPGQPAVIGVDAYGGREYHGQVDSIAAATGARFSLLPPENATGNYVKVVQRIPVKIVFDKGQDPEHLLRPGMSVYATVRVR